MEYKVKQIQPNHADHISYYNKKYLQQMFDNEEVVCEPKYDGERMLVHFNGNETYCTSRRYSKKTDRYMENQDKIKNLPHINELDYTVIDCEFYSDTWANAVSVLHSLPERAYDLQNTVDVKFAVFDCLFFDGKDVRDKPYLERLFLAATVLLFTKDSRFHQVPFSKVNNIDECYEMMNYSINAGFEGVVVKSLDKSYYDEGASLKCKKFETVDVVVYDYQKGHGKYSDTIGALKVGYYDEENDKIVHVSKVNCGTDEERNYWYEHWNELQHTVIEVKCQEITDRSLRHPVYIRRRPDKSYQMCKKDTIFKE